jgi:histidyl-tRNA synthetase
MKKTGSKIKKGKEEKKVKKEPKKKIEKPQKISPEEEKASEIATHYGFSPLPETEVEKKDIEHAQKFLESRIKSLHPFKYKADRFSGYLEEKIALIRSYLDKKFITLSQPVTAYYTGPMKGNPHMKKTPDEETFNLEIIGSSKSISDAMVIETAFVILEDRYPEEDLYVEINSIGDKDSVVRFSRELQNFIKKEGNKLCKTCKEKIKKDAYAIFSCSDIKCKDVNEKAPKPMSYLSESSRNHFKEVLEYLESLNIAYSINHKLIGSRSYCTDTVFEIKSRRDNTESVLGIGERYNSLSKKIWGHRDIPAVSVALSIHPHFITRKKLPKLKVEKSKFFFIQIGFDAKLKSLALLETLRKAKVPVLQSLSKDKLSVQLQQAEKMEIPYILIMGQKEAMENSIVVRNFATRCQETVFLNELIPYLKKLK